jgi:hypothetical protein
MPVDVRRRNAQGHERSHKRRTVAIGGVALHGLPIVPCVVVATEPAKPGATNTSKQLSWR